MKPGNDVHTRMELALSFRSKSVSHHTFNELKYSATAVAGGSGEAGQMNRFRWTAAAANAGGTSAWRLRHAQPPLKCLYLCSSVANYRLDSHSSGLIE
jgi:hypothetical protein